MTNVLKIFVLKTQHHKKIYSVNVFCLKGLIIVIVLLQGCYLGLEFSPYSTDVDYENLNAKNIAWIKSIEQESANYKIGLIADTHRFYTETDKLISVLNSLEDLDFVIILGDITDIGLMKEFNWATEIFEKLHYPFIVVVGNHEFLGNGENIYKKIYGPLNFNFTFRGTQFVFFNDNNWESGEPDWLWLNQVASSTETSHRILFAHIDCSIISERFNEKQVNTFNDIVKSHFDLVFHAHDHKNSMKVVDGIPRYHVGSPQNNQYVILEYYNSNNSFLVDLCTY